ncbi:DNA polymerase III alpha subunit [Paraburkholderia sp. WC7.3d]
MDTTFSMLPAYAELFCFSNFTFLHGASHAEELAERAAQLGYSALAITDECSLAGVVRAHVAAKAAKLPFIVGSYCRLRNADGSPAFGLILLARNREGYGNLSELVTIARTRAPKGEYRVTPQDLSRPEREYRHLLGMPDCLAILVPEFPAKEDVLDAQVEWLDDTFTGRAWVGLVLHQRALDDIHRGSVEFIARKHDVPVVALGSVVMHVRSRKPLQDTMTAIRVGKAVNECGYDLAPIFQQILGFGEYGFPESHAASFALLVYASGWLKRHEPEAFLAAMLNSQPMGFYSPSQLVQDAKRHGVQVLPVDVTISAWNSSLQSIDRAGKPAVRPGLSLLRSMRDGAAERIENSRAVRQFKTVSDLARRAELDRHDLQVLAAANALTSLAGMLAKLRDVHLFSPVD